MGDKLGNGRFDFYGPIYDVRDSYLSKKREIHLNPNCALIFYLRHVYEVNSMTLPIAGMFKYSFMTTTIDFDT